MATVMGRSRGDTGGQVIGSETLVWTPLEKQLDHMV